MLMSAPDIVSRYGEEGQREWREHAQWGRLGSNFNVTKRRFLVVWHVLRERQDLPRIVRAALHNSILHGAYGSMETILTDALGTPERSIMGKAKSYTQSLFGKSPASMEAQSILVRAQEYEARVSAPDFLASLEGFAGDPGFAKAREELEGEALRSLKHMLDDKTTRFSRAFLRLQREHSEYDIDQRLKAEQSRIEYDYNLELVRKVGNTSLIGERQTAILIAANHC